MQRTIISLEPECREWLAEQAQREHVPQTEVVRRALRLYREKAAARGAAIVRGVGPAYQWAAARRGWFAGATALGR